MKKRAMIAALLTLVCLTFSSCGYPPTERQTFPICLTLDLTKDGKIQFGIQAPQNGQASDGGAAPAYNILSATGDTTMDALRILAASTPYPLNFCQLRLLIIGYELAATTELRGLLRELEQLPTMRPNAFVMVALGNALKVMDAQKPDFGMRLSTHLNLLFERLLEEDMLPDSTLSACVRELGENRIDLLLSICALNSQLVPEEQKQSEGGGESGGGGSGGSGGSGQDSKSAFAVGQVWSMDLLPDELIAGMLPRTSNNPIEYLGCATVSDGRVSGLLNARDTQLVLHALRQAKRKVAIEGDRVQLQIWVKEDEHLYENRDLLLQAVKRLQLLDCDALGFGGESAHSFYLNAEWEALDFRRKYEDAEVVVSAW